MKKAFLIIICLLANTISFAQGVNKMDADGKRHGLWKGTYETSKRPRYEGTFEHGKETGTFKFFEDNGKSTLAATRVFAADGSCYTTFFDEKGAKVSEGREVNKEREGEWKFYHPGGTVVMLLENYSKGKLNGARKTYFPDGKIAEEANYVKGGQNGTYKRYTEKGIVLEESTYKEGKLEGPALYRNAHGDIVSKGKFANNKKTGVWEFYEKGKVVKKEDMTNKKVQLARKDRKN